MADVKFWSLLDREWAKLLAAFPAGDYLPPPLLRAYHAELIYVASNLRKDALSLAAVTAVVNDYPDVPPGQGDSILTLQVVGQKRALDLVEAIAKDPEPPRQSELVRQIHACVMQDADPQGAGVYRAHYLRLADSSVMTALPMTISAEMASFADSMERQASLIPPSTFEVVSLAAWAHHELTRIHPFSDANGRVARIYFNYICRRFGLPYVVIPKVKAAQRMDESLKSADGGDLGLAVRYYGDLLADSFRRLLKYHLIDATF